MINGEHTRHHLSALWNLLQSGVVHATSLSGYNLFFSDPSGWNFDPAQEFCSNPAEAAYGSHVRSAPVYHNCNRGSCWGVELVALKASTTVSGDVVPTAAVAVVD